MLSHGLMIPCGFLCQEGLTGRFFVGVYIAMVRFFLNPLITG